MEIVGLQIDTCWEDKAATHARTRNLLASANIVPGSLVVLSEYFATGYSKDVPGIAEKEGDGLTQRFFSELAIELKSTVLGGVVVSAPSGRGANQCVVYSSDGKEICRYWKLHPFTYGGETEHYDAGRSLMTFQWQGLTVAPLICYDLRFPEVFRAAVRQGVKVFTVIANWPAPRREHWMTLLRARAIEDQAYVVGVNRCGNDPTLAYAGDSRIIDPRGQVLADAGDREQIIRAAVNVADLEEYRRTFPALSDMRPEFHP